MNFDPTILGYTKKEFGYFKEIPELGIPLHSYKIEYKLKPQIGELVTIGGTVPYKEKTDFCTGINEDDAKANAQKKLDQKWAGSIVTIESATKVGTYDEDNPIVVHWITIFEDNPGNVQLYAYFKGDEQSDDEVYNTQILTLKGQDELAKLVEIFTRKNHH